MRVLLSTRGSRGDVEPMAALAVRLLDLGAEPPRAVVDQPYYAGRVADLGIGVAHDGPVPTLASLSAALGTALGAEIRARAADVAGRVRADGAMAAAKLLFEQTS
ncbi:hypothetical protein [Nonomuraea sp. NPDC049709]|uniref:hypothetical protein n=1 Tax=Nonomuraea sp. NPDC049709 TaxID=3154736 RepID=UPI00343C55AA